MRKTLTKNKFEKIRRVSLKLRDILERDGVTAQFSNTYDYLVRSVIEALGIERLFYDPEVSPFIEPSTPEEG